MQPAHRRDHSPLQACPWHLPPALTSTREDEPRISLLLCMQLWESRAKDEQVPVSSNIYIKHPRDGKRGWISSGKSMSS